MSINSAMQAGVSGLSANSAALAAISQNIANVNTIGYKRTQGEFQTIVNSQSKGAGGYAAGGVMTTARHFISQEGQLQRTSESTDLAIDGQGFFVTTEKAEGVGATDSRLFTRAGAFRIDDQGYLKNSAGLYLQGWPVDSNGDIATDPSDLTRLRSINIGTVGGTAEKTTRAQINANLYSGQTISTAASPNKYSAALTAPATGTKDMSVRYSPTATPNVYDVTIVNGTETVNAVATYDAAGVLTGLAGLPAGASVNAALDSLTLPSGVAVELGATGLNMHTDSVAQTKYDPIRNSMAMYNGDDDNPLGIKPDFKINIPVSDSKGGQRNIEIRLLKSDVANQWYAEIVAVPADSVETGGAYSHGQIKTGMIAFTPSGRLDVVAMQTTLANPLFDPANALLDFNSSDSAAPDPADTNDQTVKWADGLGISSQTLTLDLNTSAGGLSQLNTASIVQSTVTNGTAFGNLSEIKIDEGGFVTAIFDNGVMRRIAQVAIATFPSPDSLRQVTGNAFRVSLDSGTFNLKSAGTGGAGMLAAQQLESSTVDLSAEFTSLITTQRAYSASSKIITTADEMLAELLSIKR